MFVEFFAYRVHPDVMDLVPADPRREWMDATPNKFANRCLPLTMANASGWELRQRGSVTAVWSGDMYPHDITILNNGCPLPPTAHFGGGVLTWNVPYLFRTPPGWNLMIRGPANWPKDGATPLEGLLETDWMTQTTTYNIKMTRPGHAVTWEDGEPIAMIVPVKRDDLEDWQPIVADIPKDLGSEVDAFRISRSAFNSGPRGPKDWQKLYSQGTSPGGSVAPEGEHRRNRKLKPFDQR